MCFHLLKISVYNYIKSRSICLIYLLKMAAILCHHISTSQGITSLTSQLVKEKCHIKWETGTNFILLAVRFLTTRWCWIIHSGPLKVHPSVLLNRFSGCVKADFMNIWNRSERVTTERRQIEMWTTTAVIYNLKKKKKSPSVTERHSSSNLPPHSPLPTPHSRPRCDYTLLPAASNNRLWNDGLSKNHWQGFFFFSYSSVSDGCKFPVIILNAL